MSTTGTSITVSQLQNDLSSFGQSITQSAQLLSQLLYDPFSGISTDSVSSSQLVSSYPGGASITITGQNLNALSDGTFMAGTSQPITINGISLVDPVGGGSASVSLNVVLTQSAGIGSAVGSISSLTAATPYLGLSIDFSGTQFAFGDGPTASFGSLQDQIHIRNVNVWFSANGGGISNTSGNATIGGDLQYNLSTQTYSGSVTSLLINQNGQTDNLSGFSVPFDHLFNGVSDSTICAEILGQGSQVIVGGTGNDTLSHRAGGDIVDGGSGFNTMVYTGNLANNHHTITRTATGYTVSDNVGSGGTDTLTNIERLQFADTKLALDMDVSQSGGETALLLGACLGTGPWDRSLVGTVMSIFDAGYNLSSISAFLVSAGIVTQMAGGADNRHFVDWICNNVLGAPPSTEVESFCLGILNAGWTQATFLALIAGSELNQAHINLVGYQATGIEYM